MLITNHVLSGALVGTVATDPVTAFVVGVASHFTLDTVPHWGDRDTFLQVAVVDGLVGLAVMGAVAVRTPRDRRCRVVAGMLGACLPDADKPSELFFGRSPFPLALDDWHRRIQRESPRRLPQEVLVAVGAGLVLRGVLSSPRPGSASSGGSGPGRCPAALRARSCRRLAATRAAASFLRWS